MNLMIESDKQTRLMIRGFETYSEIFCVVFDRVTMINDNLVTLKNFIGFVVDTKCWVVEIMNELKI
jgi:hypothetical protein